MTNNYSRKPTLDDQARLIQAQVDFDREVRERGFASLFTRNALEAAEAAFGISKNRRVAA